MEVVPLTAGLGTRPLSTSLVSVLLLLTFLYPAAVPAQDTQLIDCYGFDGIARNSTKCPNSNACCGPKATCLSNNLCANPGDAENRWVRGPCAVKGWDPECAQVCLYSIYVHVSLPNLPQWTHLLVEEKKGVFPRVVLCADGTLCCDNNPQCCEAKLGVFLDENGNRVYAKATGAVTSYPPIPGSYERFTQTPSTDTTTGTSTSTTSSSSTSESTPSSLTLTSPTNPAAADPSSSTSPFQQTPSPDTSLSLKVGLGLGIPLAALLTACAVWFLLRRRNRRRAAATANTTPALPAHTEVSPSYMYSSQPVYGSVPKPPGYASGGYPVELLGQTATELDGERRRYEMHS